MKKCFIFLVLVTFCSIINAEINDTIYVQRNENGAIRFARFQASEQINDTAFMLLPKNRTNVKSGNFAKSKLT
jgi:hypothetical protein